MIRQKVQMLLRFLTCAAILIVAAIQINGSLFGHDVSKTENSDSFTPDSVATVSADGNAVIINTSSLTPDVKGFAGPTPLQITIQGQTISEIQPLPNSETEEFFARVQAELIPKWIGTKISDVGAKQVDAVSGATFSSEAVNANVRAGAEYLIANSDIITAHQPSQNSLSSPLSWKWWAALIVVLAAAIIPLFVKNKYYRYTQLLLNVIILGFWTGTFLSYELFINYLSFGCNLLTSLVTLIMLAIAFIYPYFGRHQHYCSWVCPLGSIQELAGRSLKYKIKISPKALKALTLFQEYLWVVLMILMVTGLWTEWIHYELFKAFLFKSAAIGVVIAGIVALLLSFVVTRPYCRFICPTGCLFKFSEGITKFK